MPALWLEKDLDCCQCSRKSFSGSFRQSPLDQYKSTLGLQTQKEALDPELLMVLMLMAWMAGSFSRIRKKHKNHRCDSLLSSKKEPCKVQSINLPSFSRVRPVPSCSKSAQIQQDVSGSPLKFCSCWDAPQSGSWQSALILHGLGAPGLFHNGFVSQPSRVLGSIHLHRIKTGSSASQG